LKISLGNITWKYHLEISLGNITWKRVQVIFPSDKYHSKISLGNITRKNITWKISLSSDKKYHLENKDKDN
jgi:hypothetical protein